MSKRVHVVIGALTVGVLAGCIGSLGDVSMLVPGAAGGDKSKAPKNASPVISAFVANPTTKVKAGGTITFSVDATDADGDTLSYRWAATEGTLSTNSGKAVFWTTPKDPGAYSIQVVITDGNGGAADSSLNLTVLPDGTTDLVAMPSDINSPSPTPTPSVTSSPSPTPTPSDINSPSPTPTPSVSLIRTISTVAGNGTAGFAGDQDDGLRAQLNLSLGSHLAIDSVGSIFIADTANNRIRKVDATGRISTVVGSGSAGFSGDGGPATGATLSSPMAVVVESSGNLYIADTGNNRIRKVDAATGRISTLAGNGDFGDPKEGVPANLAVVYKPKDIAIATNGDIYYTNYSAIRKIEAATGKIVNVVNSGGQYGFSGDGKQARDAQINTANSIALDAQGNLYIADTGNDRIRKVTAATGIIDTVAGSQSSPGPSGGTFGYGGDGGMATSAKLNDPYAVAVDSTGNLYIADTFNNCIRFVAASTGIIRTIAGAGQTVPGEVTYGFSGDGGLAVQARMNWPSGLAIAGNGVVFLTDARNQRVRRLQ